MTRTRTTDARLIVQVGDDLVEVDAGTGATFGRDADIVVGADDPLLHREVGALLHHDGRWTVANRARRLSLVLTDVDGPSYAILAPGSDMALPWPGTHLRFSTAGADHRLCLRRPDDARDAPPSDVPTVRTDFDATATRSRPRALTTFNAEQLQLLRALAAPRLAGPVTAADLPGNAHLAATLGWSRAKFNRKLDHLCLKFHRAGVSGMVGSEHGHVVDAAPGPREPRRRERAPGRRRARDGVTPA